MPTPYDDSPLMRAARRQPAGSTPIWLMRQAGRFMPEYRELRRRVGFLELCHDPDLCAEVAVMAVEQLGVDAAILFSDLLVILPPMGIDLSFATGEGPVLSNPIRHPADVDRLLELTDLAPLEYVMEAVRRTRAAIPAELPLIGFAGAPFTLASYAIEGGGSRSYQATKLLMYRDEGAWHAMLDRLARAVAAYLSAQVAAGAQVLQLFDSWVGCLGVDDYRRYVLPHSRTVLASLPADVPVIHFTTGNPALLAAAAEAGGNLIGVDWRVPLDQAWQAVGHERGLQGNLDPAVLLADIDTIRREATRVLRQAEGRPGYIFNLGHGVLPETPVDHVRALVDIVHEYQAG